MDSPERSPKTVKVTDTQGSPFFTYLCSLSPIQPVKSVHVAQTFSELSFPPPPAVFVSPRVDQKSTACLRRVFSDSKAELFKASVDHQTENARARKQKSRIGNGVASFSRIKIHNSSPCNDTTKCDQDLVEQYLTDPVETGLYNSIYQQDSTESAHFDTDQSNMHVTINESEECEISALPTSRVLEANNDENCVELHSKEPVECQLPLKLGAMNDKLHEMLEITGRMKVETSLTREDQAEKAVNPSSDLNVQELVLMENRDLEQFLGIDESAPDFTFLLSGASNELSRQNNSAQMLNKQSLSLLKSEREKIITGDIEGREKDLELSEDCKAQLVLEAKEEKEAEASMDDLAAADIRPSNANTRGIRRRCLDFQTIEEQKNRLGNFSLRNSSAGQISSQKIGAMSGIVAIRQYQQGSEKKPSVSSTLEIEAGGSDLSPDIPIPSSRQVGDCGQERPDSDHFGFSQISIGMPSGIGLHLNSLTGALTQTRDGATSNATNILTPLISACSIPTVCPLHCRNELASETFQNKLSANSEPGMAISSAEKARMEMSKLESENEVAKLATNLTTIGCHSFSIEDMTTEDMLLLGGGDDDQKISPVGRKRVLLQEFCQQGDSDAQDDSGQSPPSPRKKRKSGSSGDGCKRCSCKKSKCLKLYCDCFAAGVYCADPCSCHDCFNKPEFEDTVLGTRQQIESRNPLAFAPKIVRAADSSLINGDENGETPASARHKRGCNCKKSMCLKKYCECYQAGVGCSDGCRCKRCKNVHGRKEVSEEFDDETPQAELADREFAENKPDFGIGLVVPDCYRNNELSPLTPFQPLGHSGSSEKLISSRKRQSIGDDFISPILSQSQSQSPSGILCSSNRAFISTMTPLVHSQMSSMKTTPMAASSALKISRFGQFSPGWDGLGDICTLTPLPQAPSRPTPASSSIQDRIDSSPCFSHQTD